MRTPPEHDERAYFFLVLWVGKELAGPVPGSLVRAKCLMWRWRHYRLDGEDLESFARRTSERPAE